MYKAIKGKYYFVHVKDGVTYEDPFIPNFTQYLKHIDLEWGTIETYISKIHKFWIYALYFQSKPGQSFLDYILEYRQIIINNGFILKKQITEENTGITIDRVLFEVKKTTSPSSDMRALEKFYRYLTNPGLNPLFGEIGNLPIDMYFDRQDEAGMRAKEKHGKGHGYGLKSRGIMRSSLLERVTVFTDLARSKKYRHKAKQNINDSQAISIEAFDELLKDAKNPRDRLIYLLCGACSARRSQALNLTRYDIDLVNKKVYLPDPLSHERPVDDKGRVFLGQPPRIELLRSLGINPHADPHRSIAHKYPIPIRGEPDRSLTFLPGPYEKMFFDTYSELLKTIHKDTPFVFQTLKGDRWKKTRANETIRRDFDKLDNKYPEFHLKNLTQTFHSLRHMYGRTMANLAYFLDAKHSEYRNMSLPGCEEPVSMFNIIKLITQHAMGHESTLSTDVYFNPSGLMKDFATEHIQKNIDHVNAISSKILSTYANK